MRHRMGLLGAVWVGVLGAAVFSAAPGAADSTAQFDDAIASVRAAGPCSALRHDPVVQRAAELSNRSTDDYLDHKAGHVPVSDPLFVLHDLGSDAERAIQLQGQGPDLDNAIKGALLQGHSAIPNCSYTRVGTSVIHNVEQGLTLVVAVLAG